MKLKKLEICGFKSFYDKAVIDFPLGICAIVGPNGCGKSNIIDALRWAMGETSVKQLRGKAMEDIIFAGAAGKEAINLAEVSLTLDNSDGTAPPELNEYTEICITRRLYRSGETAYLLNKRPCRLKDIHNLFLGSSMGARSFSVIQQGSIGAITDASPHERRIFIEEAAGVTRYKTRKTEALRKVEQTNQNLLRVQDILFEVERQMTSLKHQAQKAEIFKSYRERIRYMDISLSYLRYMEISKELRESHQNLQELKNSEIEQNTLMSQLDAQLEAMRLRQQQRNDEIERQRTAKFNKQREVDSLESELRHNRLENERLTVEVRELSQRHASAADQNRDLDEEIAQIETNSESIRREIAELQAELAQKDTGLKEFNSRNSALTDALRRAQSRYMDLSAKEAKYKNQFETKHNSKESLKRRLARADEEAALAEAAIETAESAQSQAREALDERKQRAEELELELRDLRQEIDRRREILRESVKQLQTLEVDRSALKARLAVLAKMESNLEWYKDGAKALLKRFEEDNTGLLALVADIFTAQAPYDVLLENVLEDQLQYFVMDNAENAYATIKYLRNGQRGRGGFLINGQMPLNPHNTALPNRLLNKVQVKDGFKESAEYLLGDVVIAEDIYTAELLRDELKSPARIVTMDGEVLAVGLMIGGNSKEAGGILVKKQELRDLNAKMGELEDTLNLAKQAQKQIGDDVREAEMQLSEKNGERNYLQNDILEAEKQVYSADQDLKNARRHLEIVQLEQDQLLGEHDDLEDEIRRFQEAIEDLEQEVQDAQAESERVNKEIYALSNTTKALNDEIADLRVQISNTNGELESQQVSLRRLTYFRKDSVERFQSLARELSQKQNRLEELTELTETHQERIETAHADLTAAATELARNEDEFNVLRNELAQNDEAVSKIESARTAVNKKIQALKLERAQKQARLESMMVQLQDRYNTPFANLIKEYESAGEKPVDQNGQTLSMPEIEALLEDLRGKISKITDVNLNAIEEYNQQKERADFLNTQKDDLEAALKDLHKLIGRINQISQEKFMDIYNKINVKINEVFPKLFNGGSAQLVLLEDEHPLEAGVEMMIHPPGKKLTRLSLLSGGEKALSAIAFIFAIFLLRPSSFCLLDEIDAPLDETNVLRFNDLLKMIGRQSQILMITHNKHSMSFADMLFGITMEQKGVSKVVSVNFERDAKIH